jgi:hypothetical protein
MFLEPGVDGDALLSVHVGVAFVNTDPNRDVATLQVQGMYFSSCKKSSLGISVPNPISLQ